MQFVFLFPEGFNASLEDESVNDCHLILVKQGWENAKDDETYQRFT